ncbi:MAG: hypothetical protein PHV30_02285 [Candidatus Margulisbacteria bacterium]|nr:hypothetical protein [Candidatus Margulisiibacteriota bacterium]
MFCKIVAQKNKIIYSLPFPELQAAFLRHGYERLGELNFFKNGFQIVQLEDNGGFKKYFDLAYNISGITYKPELLKRVNLAARPDDFVLEISYGPSTALEYFGYGVKASYLEPFQKEVNLIGTSLLARLLEDGFKQITPNLYKMSINILNDLDEETNIEDAKSADVYVVMENDKALSLMAYIPDHQMRELELRSLKERYMLIPMLLWIPKEERVYPEFAGVSSCPRVRMGNHFTNLRFLNLITNESGGKKNE